MRLRNLVIAMAAFATTLSAAVVLTCASAAAAEYYHVDGAGALYVAWTEDRNGRLEGQMDVLVLSKNGTRLESHSTPFTGTRDGSNVSLTMHPDWQFSGITWTGTIYGNTLSLTTPGASGPSEIVLKAGSIRDFTRATYQLRQSAASGQYEQNLRSAYNYAQNRVNSDITWLSQDLNGLRQNLSQQTTPIPGSLDNAYQRVLQQMQANWEKEQVDSERRPFTCAEKSDVESDASDVESGASDIGGIDSDANSFLETTKGDITSALDRLSDIERWVPVADARANQLAAFLHSSRTQNQSAEVSRLKAYVNSQVSYVQQRLESALEQIQAYDSSAASISRNAQSLPKTLTCSE